MATPTGRFRRADRLLHSRDYRRVMDRGRRAAGRGFVLFVARGEPRCAEEQCRLGLTVSRRVGNAAVRNRTKRRIREWFRRERHRLPEGTDLVVIARREAVDLTSHRLGETLGELTERSAQR